jgi:hypothetical protein
VHEAIDEIARSGETRRKKARRDWFPAARVVWIDDKQIGRVERSDI